MQMRRDQPRSVAFLYGGIAGVLLMVIATVALIVAPPSPPSVAEFAPGAMDTIEEPPEGQPSLFGVGEVDCLPASDCAAVGGEEFGTPPGSGLASTIERARVRRCVGDPPRQIEDPQSPPCVNYWEGDNGGSTSRGVTRDEIRFAVAGFVGMRPHWRALTNFFNSRFEFYGRRIRVVEYPHSSPNSPADQRVNAVAAHETEAFAASSLSCDFDSSGRCDPYWREASRLGLVTVSQDTESASTSFEDLHPFIWTYFPPSDRVARYLGEFTCKSLVGKTARYAGGREVTQMRRFAVLQLKDSGVGRADAGPLLERIRSCGGEVALHEFAGTARGERDQTGNRLLMADLQQREVTTIVVFGEDRQAVNAELMSNAQRTGYQPEWVITSVGATSWETRWQTAPADQTQHMFGVLVQNKDQPTPDKPYTWAYRDQGEPIPQDRGDSVSDVAVSSIYHEMLLLASGIQAAGPRLTPQTFARGLRGLAFPNPGAAGPPYYQGTVGLKGDHSMVDDAGLVWWSATAPAYSYRVSDAGGWCYVDRGRRWHLSKWPVGDPNLFDPDPRNCR